MLLPHFFKYKYRPVVVVWTHLDALWGKNIIVQYCKHCLNVFDFLTSWLFPFYNSFHIMILKKKRKSYVNFYYQFAIFLYFSTKIVGFSIRFYFLLVFLRLLFLKISIIKRDGSNFMRFDFLAGKYVCALSLMGINFFPPVIWELNILYSLFSP